MNCKIVKILFFISIFIAPSTWAQVFDEDSFSSEESLENSFFTNEENTINENKEIEEELNAKPLDGVNFFMPGEEPQQKTTPINKAKRGDAVIERIYKEGEEEDEFPYVIFLSMENFKISPMGAFSTTCSMRFTILTNFENTLSSIDLKVIWPDIRTTLSFPDVLPYQTTYVDYTLLGEGCYSMNETPNIEVNRCRSKSMSQEQCASAIMWVKK